MESPLEKYLAYIQSMDSDALRASFGDILDDSYTSYEVDYKVLVKHLVNNAITDYQYLLPLLSPYISLNLQLRLFY